MKETEHARTRRRWITLGEIVGIGALVISALSYWDAHQQRATPVTAASSAVPRAMPLVLTGAPDAAHDRIDLHPASAEQVVQTATIRFPASVRTDAIETTGSVRIEAAWFDGGLRAALKGTKPHTGRRRLAVGIETTYVDQGTTRTDRAVYDVGYTLHGRLLRPDAVVLEGIALVRRTGPDLAAAVDARFAGQVPAADGIAK